ncbi:DUF1801 domain-containing protein [Asticcacaulis sp. DXS10W]|uniref:DUF1801 domain-containing protein n=1 Tax=Asticcacaulis currens TaxID=2984210 RepID=A0ABT5IFB2_9CAUL|nr:DUF1801 domain-containing protein [Asticcacaulis currens]MDC7694864.1 DUF1801 domain-containing protein [Asticcacaulis currens]
MAEPKTQPTDADPAAFLDARAPEKMRADAHTLLGLFAEVTGEPPVVWGTSLIGYGQYSYLSGKTRVPWPLSAFAARSAALTLYVLASAPEQADHLARLGKHTTGGGCLYIKRLSDVDLDVLRDIISTAHALMRARHLSS